MNKIVIDTEILLLSLIDPDSLDDEVKEMIYSAQKQNNLYISSISLIEIGALIKEKKVKIYTRISEFMASIYAIDGLNIIEMNSELLADSINFSESDSISYFKYIILASVRDVGAIFITKDENLFDMANRENVRAKLV